MHTFIPKGLSLRTTSGGELRLTERLGNGGTGEVWAGQLDADAVVVKWYYPAVATAPLRGGLEKLVARDAPSDRFCWPRAVLGPESTGTATAGFGVVMPVRQDRFRSLLAHMHGAVPVAPAMTLLAAISFCRAFADLDASRLGLTDLALKDLHFDPAKGDVCLCALDGVVPIDQPIASGESLPPFGATIAPELTTGGAASPSPSTNHYSLAAVLLALLVGARPDESPLEPHKMTPTPWAEGLGAIRQSSDVPQAAGERLRPVARWLGLTPRLRELFTIALGDDTSKDRPTPAEWVRALTAFRDALLVCTNDGIPFSADIDPATGAFETPTPCPMCDVPQSPFPQALVTGGADGGDPRPVALTVQCPMLFGDHIRPDGDPLVRVGYIRPHKTEAGVYGYYNEDTEAARWIPPSGPEAVVEPAKPFRVAPGGVLLQGKSEIRFAIAPPAPQFSARTGATSAAPTPAAWTEPEVKPPVADDVEAGERPLIDDVDAAPEASPPPEPPAKPGAAAPPATSSVKLFASSSSIIRPQS